MWAPAVHEDPKRASNFIIGCNFISIFLGSWTFQAESQSLPSAIKTIFFVGYLQILDGALGQEPTQIMVMVVNGRLLLEHPAKVLADGEVAGL